MCISVNLNTWIHMHIHLKIMSLGSTDCMPFIILIHQLQLVSMICDQRTYKLIGEPHGVCVFWREWAESSSPESVRVADIVPVIAQFTREGLFVCYDIDISVCRVRDSPLTTIVGGLCSSEWAGHQYADNAPQFCSAGCVKPLNHGGICRRENS